MDYKRVTIFTGNYGSGKTEISINYSLFLSGIISHVLLVDLDVVNPYFRSREKTELLAKNDIEVIYPHKLLYADLPIIPAEIQKLTTNRNNYGVIDLGGDEEGATVLGSISPKLSDQEYELNLVVNNFRSFTRNQEGIIETRKRIEDRSRLKVDNLICNANLGRETGIDDIKKGYLIIKETALKLEIPIKFISVRRDLLPLMKEDFEVEEELFPIDIYMNPPW